jgi:hypothetical protein
MANKYETGGGYTTRYVKNLQTGAVVTEWDRVTVGKAKTVWDVSDVLADGMVRLHRQNPGGPPYKRSGVVYRLMNMDRLTVVEKAGE